jgi:hypothetical protein
VEIPIINGIYTDGSPSLRTSYPVNLYPVPKSQGVSASFLKPADGIVSSGTGPGTDRGAINWRGTCYRVMGTKLCTVSSAGAVSILGDVGGPTSELVSMDYSFDRLAIASGGRLYYWDGTTLTQVTDPDLGTVLDVAWVDGYFMTTDGTSLVVTELTDPTQVNPLKYGSSEVDPDPVVAILKLRNEIHALNRNTIEIFDNVGGDFFPFSRIDGAQIQKGCVGTQACCVFVEMVAFLGSGRNESPGIYLGANATAKKISTQEIDQTLLLYTEAQLALTKLEARNDKTHQHLYVHLPDRTLVYDAAASAVLEQPVWFCLASTLTGFAQYKARSFVWAYDQWLVGDPTSSAVGYLDDTIGSHWGAQVRWEFATTILYNESRRAIFYQLELVALTGRVAINKTPRISTSYSFDGLSWSQDKAIEAGTIGATRKRLVWFRQGMMQLWRIQRFRGDSDAHLSFLRLEASIEALAS